MCFKCFMYCWVPPLRAGGFSVDKRFGLRIKVVDRTIDAPTGVSNVVQMFETVLVQCARHTLEACEPGLTFREVAPLEMRDAGLVPEERRSGQEGY